MTIDEMHVVSGVLVHPTRSGVLMGLRRRGGLRPLLWEFPGGKVEPADRCPRVALKREWLEELSLYVSVGERIATAIVDADVCVLVELFEVSFPDTCGSPTPPPSHVHECTRWVEPEYAVRRLGCSPAFYGHYRFLRLWWERLRRSP